MRSVGLVLAMALMAAILLLGGSSAAPADAPSAGKDQGLPSLLERVLRETGVPGIAAAVVDRRGMVAIAAVGRRRADEDIPLSTSDRFHLGSDTKAMTAFVAARLVERGILRWDTTLAEAFPEWSGTMNEGYRTVRLTDLLRHRSGMPALTGVADFWLFDGVDSEGPLLDQRRAFAKSVLHHAPAGAPRERFLYSNAGYMVVGAVLEKRAGKAWEELMREELFAPLAMTSCGFGPPARGDARGAPFGHRPSPTTGAAFLPTDADNPPVMGPAGTVHCSLADWSSFVRANMEDPPLALVKPETLALLHEPLPLEEGKEDMSGYAMGWATGDPAWAGGRVLGHNGSNGKSLAAVRLAAHRGLAFLVVVNAGDERAEQAVKRVYEALAARHAASEVPDLQGRPGRPPAAR